MKTTEAVWLKWIEDELTPPNSLDFLERSILSSFHAFLTGNKRSAKELKSYAAIWEKKNVKTPADEHQNQMRYVIKEIHKRLKVKP